MNKLFHNERYQTQIALEELGEDGQKKLSAAKVLVVGAGGLGCPTLQYLAAAGIGVIGIIDNDIVSLSNLHRQILFGINDLGEHKVVAAKRSLMRLNPEIIYPLFKERLSKDNALEIIEYYDIVIDCTDNLASKYLINDACVLLKKPFVYAGISRYEGQVALFNIAWNAANYRDLFPQLPREEQLDCRFQGVLGVLPGIIGCMQAAEAIKWITSIGSITSNAILSYNMLQQKIYTYILLHHSKNQLSAPKNAAAFKDYNYASSCNRNAEAVFSIDMKAFEKLRSNKNVAVIDIRQLDEKPELSGFAYLKIPDQDLYPQLQNLPYEQFILICQTGKRSLVAAKKITKMLDNHRKIVSLSGGILQWENYSLHKLQ
ncbi:ThiF family adenylyltransferase [Arachidicoccus sp.]|uniref:ThiF family adenylyltransferase n=1 Tax=Arachidicoccus sp. TaxID=1872624 RepID=UPI003D20C51B